MKYWKVSVGEHDGFNGTELDIKSMLTRQMMLV